MDAERLGNWRHDGSGFQLGLTNLRDLSSVDPADSAAWRPVVRHRSRRYVELGAWRRIVCPLAPWRLRDRK